MSTAQLVDEHTTAPPSPVRRVDWRGVLADLADTYPTTAQVARDLAGRFHYLTPAPAMLATLATTAGPVLLVPIVEQRGGTEAVAAWLYRTARAAMRLAGPDTPTRLVVDQPGPVAVDPDLPALPLLRLAAAHARHTRRPLIVQPADLGPVGGGRYVPNVPATLAGIDHTADLIELDHAAAWPLDRGVWLHELAHTLDPATGRTAEASERFADTLADLLDHHQPTTLADLAPLVDQAHTTASPTGAHTPAATTTGPEPAGTGDLPDEGAASLITFATLLK